MTPAVPTGVSSLRLTSTLSDAELYVGWLPSGKVVVAIETEAVVLTEEQVRLLKAWLETEVGP